MQPDAKHDVKMPTIEPPIASQPSSPLFSLSSREGSISRSTTRRGMISRWFQVVLFSRGVLPAPWSHPLVGYLFAILGQALAIILVTLVMHTFPFFHFPSALVLLVVILAALGWGIGPSLVSMLVGAVLLLLLVSPLSFSSSTQWDKDIVSTVLYVVIGLTVALLTSQVQRERQAAQALSRRLETIVEALPEALYVYDQTGQVIHMNPAGRAMLERAAHENVLSSPDPLASGQPPMMRLMHGEVIDTTNAAEVTLPARDGGTIRTSVTGAPLRDRLGQVSGFVAVCHDMTNYRRVEEALYTSEERYRTIVETAHEGILLVDTETRTLYANNRMATLLGIEQARMQGRTLLEFVFPEDEAESRGRIRSNLKGHSEQFEFRFRRIDGSVLKTQASTSPVRDVTGTIIGVLGLFTDLTAHKQVEEAFLHSEALLHIALRNSPIAVFMQDRDLRYTWMENPPSLTLENIIGKTDYDFVPSDDAAHLIKIKQHVLATGESIQEEFHVRGLLGLRWELLTIEPLRDQKGTIIGLAGTSINITDRKRLEQERENLAIQAQVRASELEAIFEAMTDVVAVFDMEGHVTQMNHRAAAHLTYALHDAVDEGGVVIERQQMPAYDLEGHIIEEEFSPRSRLLRGETLVGVHSQDMIITTQEGNQRLLNVAGAPLRDVDGKQIGAVSVTRDLTEQRQLEQRTHRALDALLTMAQVMVQDGEGERDEVASVASSPRPIIQRLAELTRDVLGCERLSLLGVEDSEQLYPLAVVGLNFSQERAWWADQQLHRTNLSAIPDPQMIARLRQQEIVFLDMSQPPWDKLPNPYEVESILMVPIFLRAHLAGLLQLDYGSSSDRGYTSQDMALTQAASRLIAIILERERLLVEQAEAHRREAALRAAHQRLADLIALAHDAVIVHDPANRVLFWNQGAERLYGWTEQEALGHNTHHLLSTRFPTSQEVAETSLATTGRWEGRLIHTRRYGEEVVVESRQVLVHSVSGEPEAILEINRDITERERILQERMQAQANELAAREATHLMEEFLGIAGHELRTPLTTIKASVQLAMRSLKRIRRNEDALPADVISLLTTIAGLLERTERQAGLQDRLVSDLLDTSRIQTGRLELHLMPHNIGALVRQVVEDQQSLTPERRIHVEVPGGGDLFVIADEDRVRQVLANYVSNALKYSDAEKAVIVSVQRVSNSEMVHVAVKDEGPGLSQEQQQRIWERFYRVPGIMVKSGSGVGLGLGLHISRTLIERQGGQVGVDSQPGQGATFWFTLPLY